MNIALLSASIAGSIGLTVAIANPKRMANQAFLLTSVNATAWFLVIHFASDSNHHHEWTRLNAAIASYFPWSLSVLRYSLVLRQLSRATLFKASAPWFIACSCIVPLCFTDTFAAPSQAGAPSLRGATYILHSSALALLFLLGIFHAARDTMRQSGIRRIESQLLVFVLGSGALLCLTLIAIGNIVHSLPLKRLGLATLGLAYCITAWSITRSHIFDVKQVLNATVRYIVSIGVPTAGLAATYPRGAETTPGARTLYIAAWFILSLAISLALSKWASHPRKQRLAALRSKAIKLAAAPDEASMTFQFSRLLREEFCTQGARLVCDTETKTANSRMDRHRQASWHAFLSREGWATPEALQRKRASPGAMDLRLYMAQEDLSLIVATPLGSTQPTLIVEIGARIDVSPFTQPEIEIARNIVDLMDSLLGRYRLASRDAAKCKLDQLSVVSRGLAHDLKNLITPIASFLNHSSNRFPEGTPEYDAHRAAKNAVNIMGDYVNETLFFSATVQPIVSWVDLGQIFTSLSATVQRRADEAGVRIAYSCKSKQRFSADPVLLQRMLSNLVFNSIDACVSGQIVEVSGYDLIDFKVRIEVRDQGCGIPASNIDRLFEPYFTTKHFGHDTRGFGLGLSICKKIAELHEATIQIRSNINVGTNVIIDLPVMHGTHNNKRPAIEVNA